MSRDDKFDKDDHKEDSDSKSMFDDDDLDDRSPSSSSSSRVDDSDDDSSSGSSSSRDDNGDDDSSDGSSSRRRGRSRRGPDDDRSRNRSEEDDSIIGSSGSSRRGYTFELDNDVVTNLRRVKKNGRIKRERIEAGESWVFNKETGELVHSEIYANGTEVSVYTGPAVGELFTRASENFVPFGLDTTITSI